MSSSVTATRTAPFPKQMRAMILSTVACGRSSCRRGKTATVSLASKALPVLRVRRATRVILATSDLPVPLDPRVTRATKATRAQLPRFPAHRAYKALLDPKGLPVRIRPFQARREPLDRQARRVTRVIPVSLEQTEQIPSFPVLLARKVRRVIPARKVRQGMIPLCLVRKARLDLLARRVTRAIKVIPVLLVPMVM